MGWKERSLTPTQNNQIFFESRAEGLEISTHDTAKSTCTPRRIARVLCRPMTSRKLFNNPPLEPPTFYSLKRGARVIVIAYRRFVSQG